MVCISCQAGATVMLVNFLIRVYECVLLCQSSLRPLMRGKCWKQALMLANISTFRDQLRNAESLQEHKFLSVIEKHSVNEA